MVYEQEQEAGFQYFLGIANKRYNVHFSKLMLILILRRKSLINLI